MTYDAPEERLARELAPGEELLWSGRPRRGLMLRASDAWAIPFSLFWCGFAIFWEYSVWANGSPWFFRLWGVPFVLVGLYLVIGRFFVDAMERRRTIYGVTSSRVLILTGLFRESIRSVRLRSLAATSLTERADRSGTIVLGREFQGRSVAWERWPGSRKSEPPMLEGIPDVRNVHDLIRRAQATAE